MNALLSQLKPHKLTVDDLLVLERGGAFDGLPRVELLDGVLYEMRPQSSRHVVAKNELGFRLRLAVEHSGLNLAVLIEPTLRTTETTAPEPDIAILSQLRVEGYYPADMVKLAVEVSVTSLDTDLVYKKAHYAAAGFPEYWVVDVASGTIHQFWNPSNDDYSDGRVVAIGEAISSAAIAGILVETAGLI